MRRLLTVMTAAGTLAAVGCGSGDDGGGSGALTTPRADDEAQLAFARCMRENGVDMPDPQTDGDGRRRLSIRRAGGRDVSPQVLERATKECRDKTGGGPPELTAEQREEFRDAALAFARCMRENGVDMPDPEVGSGGGVLMRARRGSFDPGSPAFQRAQEACRDKLPRMRGGGGPR